MLYLSFSGKMFNVYLEVVTYPAAVKIFVFDPTVKSNSPVLYRVAFDKFHSYGVSEPALRLGPRDEVLISEVYLQELPAPR